MALNIGYLLDSNDSDIDLNTEGPISSSHNTLGAQLKHKAEVFEFVALEAITCNHHLRMAKDALNNKPPKGLTPTLFLTAHKKTAELSAAVDAELPQCGLKVCDHL